MTLLITGGSSGIGKATAELFAGRGWNVFELSRRDIKHDHPSIHHMSCDITDETAVAAAVEQVIAAAGHIDLLISNAGYGISGPIEFTDLADVRRQFEVNVFGCVSIIKAVLPYMRAAGRGKIIITSSVAAVLSIPYQSFYSATKSALNALALALRNEVSSFGITVCALMPGDVRTGFTAARNKTTQGADIYASSVTAVSAMEHDEENGMSATAIAQAFYSIAQKAHPAPIYTVGWQYKIFVFLESILPKRISNWIVGKLYK